MTHSERVLLPINTWISFHEESRQRICEYIFAKFRMYMKGQCSIPANLMRHYFLITISLEAIWLGGDQIAHFWQLLHCQRSPEYVVMQHHQETVEARHGERLVVWRTVELDIRVEVVLQTT